MWIYVILLIIVFYFYSFLRPLFHGAVYFPTKKEAIDTMLKLCSDKPNICVADIGSGDGRILIKFAKRGIKIDGYEINPLLYLLSKFNIACNGLNDLATVFYKSFWKVDLSNYDVIIVFGINYIMKDLKKKLSSELKPDAIILSNVFEIPGFIGNKKGTVMIYKVNN